jgi:hypothetical protein
VVEASEQNNAFREAPVAPQRSGNPFAMPDQPVTVVNPGEISARGEDDFMDKLLNF